MITNNFSRLALTLMTGTVLFFSACKKDKDSNTGPVVTKKIARVEQDANNYLNFSYNSDGTLKQVTIATTEEGTPFVKAMNLNWLDNFKLRGSWGQLGNQNVGNYPYQALLNLTGSYSFDNSGLTTGVAPQALNNPIIK